MSSQQNIWLCTILLYLAIVIVAAATYEKYRIAVRIPDPSKTALPISLKGISVIDITKAYQSFVRESAEQRFKLFGNFIGWAFVGGKPADFACVRVRPDSEFIRGGISVAIFWRGRQRVQNAGFTVNRDYLSDRPSMIFQTKLKGHWDVRPLNPFTVFDPKHVRDYFANRYVWHFQNCQRTVRGISAHFRGLGSLFVCLNCLPKTARLYPTDDYEAESKECQNAIEPRLESVQAVLLRFVFGLFSVLTGFVLGDRGWWYYDVGRRHMGIGLVCGGLSLCVFGLATFYWGWPWAWTFGVCVA